MEKALLVSVEIGRDSAWNIRESMSELEELVRSAGLKVVREMECRRPEPTPALYIGKGKAQEIGSEMERLRADVAIFGNDLSPAQVMNLEELIGMKVIDRTQLILDIFAQRARSSEGKIQVELAQLEYLLPRLTGRGVLLSRLGGGIGTRGPGEQKLEVDRRRVRDRIARLKRDLAGVRKSRAVMRKARNRSQIPVVSLVGYTNAGKSTLLNRLTDARVLVRDQMFATLDPTTRRLDLPGGRHALLTDTVGFLHELPHHLVEAFKATLEELNEAHLLVEVLDISHPLHVKQARAVRSVLKELGLDQKPLILALNKIDCIPDKNVLWGARSRFNDYDAVQPISALSGDGLEELVRLINSRLLNKNAFPARVSPRVV
ncbi:MAG: GTPase HflX [Candidatus Omnitrophica bacterium]|nr:GTPase HflX [Candidatus Omnitrophota bacterium]